MANLFNRNRSRQPAPPQQQQPISHTPEASNPTRLVRPTEDNVNRSAESPKQQLGAMQLFTTEEVVRLLQVDSAQLNNWIQIFRASLTEYTRGYSPRFSPNDISTLFFVGNLSDSGYTNEQISNQLLERREKLANKAYAEIEIVSTQEVPTIPLENNVTFRERVPDYKASDYPSPDYPPEPVRPNPIRSEPVRPDPVRSEPVRSVPDAPLSNRNGHQSPLPDANKATSITGSFPPGSVNRQANDLLSTVANSQQTVLNIQDSIRETMGVVVQDNFNLKHENRKLRERMLEIERSLAEQQRREETRKDIFEGRLRAVEGTLAAIQQQWAQLVQNQRSRGQSRRNNWFR